MKVNAVTLRDFRSYNSFTVEFDDGINVLCGKNGSGKTNLLEAIFLFAAGKSFRGSKDKDMLRFGCDSAAVRLCFENAGGSNVFDVTLNGTKKRELYKNGFKVTRLSEYLGMFRAVIFSPDHMSLVKGEPENRRRFLDVAMCQSFPRYVALLSEYNKLLSGKNALLKAESPDMLLLDIYNEKLAALAASITKNRFAFVSRLGARASEIYSEMTGGSEKLKLIFNSQAGAGSDAAELKASYETLLESRKQSEIDRRCCLYGAQRDDFTTLINDKNSRYYSSQGQQRSAVLSLKLAEGGLSEDYTGDSCVYLLDDVLSELDAYRREFILERLSGRQFIITCCEENEHVRGKVIHIQKGG